MPVPDVDAAEEGGCEVEGRIKEQGSEGAEGQGSKGAAQQGYKGAEEQGRKEQKGRQWRFEQESNREVGHPAVGGVLAHQERGVAQVVMFLQREVDLQVRRGGHGNGNAGQRAQFEAVRRPKDEAGQRDAAYGSQDALLDGKAAWKEQPQSGDDGQ